MLTIIIVDTFYNEPRQTYNIVNNRYQINCDVYIDMPMLDPSNVERERKGDQAQTKKK